VDDIDLRIEALTDRQKEVLRLVAQHLQAKEIGRALHISENTVKAHTDAARRRLGVASSRDAAKLLMIYEAQLEDSNSRIATLSERQKEILRLTAQHLQAKEIARVLDISESTVRTHLAGIRDRLKVKNSREAAVLLVSYESEIIGGKSISRDTRWPQRPMDDPAEDVSGSDHEHALPTERTILPGALERPRNGLADAGNAGQASPDRGYASHRADVGQERWQRESDLYDGRSDRMVDGRRGGWLPIDGVTKRNLKIFNTHVAAIFRPLSKSTLNCFESIKPGVTEEINNIRYNIDDERLEFLVQSERISHGWRGFRFFIKILTTAIFVCLAPIIIYLLHKHLNIENCILIIAVILAPLSLYNFKIYRERFSR